MCAVCAEQCAARAPAPGRPEHAGTLARRGKERGAAGARNGAMAGTAAAAGCMDSSGLQGRVPLLLRYFENKVISIAGAIIVLVCKDETVFFR